jgi:hypothetical protein
LQLLFFLQTQLHIANIIISSNTLVQLSSMMKLGDGVGKQKVQCCVNGLIEYRRKIFGVERRVQKIFEQTLQKFSTGF